MTGPDIPFNRTSEKFQDIIGSLFKFSSLGRNQQLHNEDPPTLNSRDKKKALGRELSHHISAVQPTFQNSCDATSVTDRIQFLLGKKSFFLFWDNHLNCLKNMLCQDRLTWAPRNLPLKT